MPPEVVARHQWNAGVDVCAGEAYGADGPLLGSNDPAEHEAILLGVRSAQGEMRRRRAAEGDDAATELPRSSSSSSSSSKPDVADAPSPSARAPNRSHVKVC